MILFKLEYPTTVEAWPKPVCEFQDWGYLPDERLTFECPDWTESVIERSFLRRPDALARVLGVTDTRHELLVLKQVARIDLYLRTHSGLHLVEMKGPKAHLQWRSAADQIARQWAQSCHWLRQKNEPVFLWAMCPVRWSLRRRRLKVPPNCLEEVAAIKKARLHGGAVAELGLIFYSLFRSTDSLLLVLWRADEPTPATGLQ